jgi:glucose-6-phosphate isomerase
MLTQNISFKNFLTKNKNILVKKKLNLILKEKNQVICSLSKSYKDSFSKKNTKHFNKKFDYRIIGMGGSTLGAQAIYDFLKKKIKKKFIFIDNLNTFKNKITKKNLNNLIISKSGNTIETIVNANVLIKKKDKNLFITEKKKSYLSLLAQELKAEVVDHNNYIGGRYSVLSEVGMLPAELMGLNHKKFRQLNDLVKNKSFMRSLVSNVESTIYFLNAKKYNSIIINYDEQSTNLFNWYQQLVAESLGKEKKGMLPIISVMPKDNHSVMQLYLDGFKNNFFTFFFTHEKDSFKLNNEKVLL